MASNLSEAGTAKFLAKVFAFHFDDAAHFVQARAHALADTVADLASNGAVAISSRVVSLDGVDPRLIGMVLTRQGDLVDTGAGAAALGDPVRVVAWLANTLGSMGAKLEAGHLVMTGALHAAVPMRAGDVFRAEFDRLGPLTVRVVE